MPDLIAAALNLSNEGYPSSPFPDTQRWGDQGHGGAIAGDSNQHAPLIIPQFGIATLRGENKEYKGQLITLDPAVY